MSTSEEKATDADQLNCLNPRIPKESLIDRATAEDHRLAAEVSACMQDLATRQEIDLNAFKAIVDADSDCASEHNGFILSESNVRFVGFNPAVTTRMGQAHRNQRNIISAKMPCLLFPCTPVALLEFVDAAGGFFEASPEFRSAVGHGQKSMMLCLAPTADGKSPRVVRRGDALTREITCARERLSKKSGDQESASVIWNELIGQAGKGCITEATARFLLWRRDSGEVERVEYSAFRKRIARANKKKSDS